MKDYIVVCGESLPPRVLIKIFEAAKTLVTYQLEKNVVVLRLKEDATEAFKKIEGIENVFENKMGPSVPRQRKAREKNVVAPVKVASLESQLLLI